MMRVWCIVLVYLLMASASWAGNTLGTGQDPAERQQAQGAMIGPAIYSGCLPSVPVSSLTLAAFACTGFVNDTSTPPRLMPVKQAAHAVGPLSGGDGVYWLAIHKDVSTTVASWNRQTGTHYLWRKSDTKPTIANGQLIAEITVASSEISAIGDLRVPSSYARNGTYDVTDPLYGGVADDSTDIGPAARLAVAAAVAQNGRVVRIPQGVYAIATSIEIPEGIEVRGDGWAPTKTPLQGINTEPRRGTWLHVSTSGFSPIRITGAQGVRLRDLAFDHDQPTVGPGWEPVDYGYTIQIDTPSTWTHGDIQLENLFFFKATYGINQTSISGMSGGRLYLNGIWGQFFGVGIRLEFLADTSRINNVHMWPYWSFESDVQTYQNAHTLGFVIQRADSLMLHNIFVFGALAGFDFEVNGVGAATGLQGTNISTDVVVTSLLVNQDNMTGQMSNLRTFGSWDGITYSPGFADAQGIVVAGDGVSLDVTNWEAGSLGKNCASVSGTSVLTLNTFRCNQLNLAGSNEPALSTSGSGVMFLSGLQTITNAHGATSYSGNFSTPTHPNGVAFNAEGTFFANVISSNPTLSFAASDYIQWLVATNQFKLSTDAGTYGTGGVKKYLCIQDGVLTVGATCP
jgi:hypothetical protein